MNKATLIWLSLAAICGTLLFHTSQQATTGRAELARLDQAVLREEDSLRVLTAEWSYLNQPERLEKLARDHLDLRPLQGQQFARLTDIPAREEPAREEPAHEEPTSAKTPANPAAPTQTATTQPSKIEPAAGKAAVKSKKPVDKKPTLTPASAVTPTPQSARAPAQTARQFDDVLKTLEVQ